MSHKPVGPSSFSQVLMTRVGMISLWGDGTTYDRVMTWRSPKTGGSCERAAHLFVSFNPNQPLATQMPKSHTSILSSCKGMKNYLSLIIRQAVNKPPSKIFRCVFPRSAQYARCGERRFIRNNVFLGEQREWRRAVKALRKC